jgi:hypothetical protein
MKCGTFTKAKIKLNVLRKTVMLSLFLSVLMMACNKKEPEAAGEAVGAAVKAIEPVCAKEITTDVPVKVGETGIVLPAKTKLCFTSDNLEIRIELPAGYGFMAKGMDKTLPVYGTYTCICSANSACQVFYADGLGFGCLQSSCSGSCTGKFTYRGYSIDKVVPTSDKESFFKEPEVQKQIEGMAAVGAYSKHDVYGVSFYLVNDVAKFMDAAKCDCEGTQACKMKVVTLLGKKIYFCEGPCNGCELTV